MRFFRLAERRIAEQTGRGVVCYVSNFSYLGDPSFVVMRRRFLSEFDRLWFDNLNGDSRETGKRTPDGKPDPSVFSTEYNREGIRLGTAIGLMVRRTVRLDEPFVHYREFWGVTKRADLVDSLRVGDLDVQYRPASPAIANRFSFHPARASVEYGSWPKLVDLCDASPISGLQEMRREVLIDIDRTALEHRMRLYYDPTLDWEALSAVDARLTQDAGDYNARGARKRILEREGFSSASIVRYALYPFDVRWCYYTVTRPLWNRPRPSLARQRWDGNRFFVTRMVAERPREHIPVTVATALPDYHLLRPNAVAIPVLLREAPDAKLEGAQATMFPGDEPSPANHRANLSMAARRYLASLGIIDPDAETHSAGLVWLHALAIGYSPAYLAENGDSVRQD